MRTIRTLVVHGKGDKLREKKKKKEEKHICTDAAKMIKVALLDQKLDKQRATLLQIGTK